MNKKLYLSFLWHMHQPYYKDDNSNKTLMPWVFLHSIKDYYDIPWYLEKFGNSKATFNLVPSLIEQIDSYINGSSNDKFLEILKKDINAITLEEESFLEEYLFLPNVENMIKPFYRFYELYLRYKEEKSFKIFSKNEIVDLQTLFLLSWCGIYLRENNQFVKELISQGRDFAHEQKIQLIDELMNFLREIVPYYKKLSDEGRISISTTPFCHPILPLLLDRNSAVEAKPGVVLPNSIANYEDFAKLQVSSAVEFFEKKFDKKVTGFWPSEGSVSNKTVELLSSEGVKWMCSDEEILFKSLRDFNKQNLYKPYKIDRYKESMNLFFRDKYLSDLIGFEYSKKNPKEAALDFISHLKNIQLNSSNNSFVSVILDGENAWEFFPNNAIEFFKELYKLLDEQTWCETVLFDEVNSLENLEIVNLDTLASGSWINGNFDIWIGSGEKNRAWELLDLTKNQYDLVKDKLDKEKILKIEKEFLIALGSDWFWWYGDDHFTELNHQFDEQFRIHLKNIFQLMEIEVPVEIFEPIVKKDKSKKSLIKPRDYIYPIIDGNNSNFYEWLNSGFIDIKKEYSTMDSSNCIIENLLYGKDKSGNLYFHLEGKKLKRVENNLSLVLTLEEKTYSFDIKKGKISSTVLGLDFDIAYDSSIELKVYNYKNEKFEFLFELYEDDKKIQRFPLYDTIKLDLESPILSNWFV